MSPPHFWSFFGFDGTDRDAGWFHETQLCSSLEPPPLLQASIEGRHIMLRPDSDDPGDSADSADSTARHSRIASFLDRNRYWTFTTRYRPASVTRFDLSGFDAPDAEDGIFRLDVCAGDVSSGAEAGEEAGAEAGAEADPAAL